MQLTAIEKETIINFNEAEKTAEIETFSKPMIRQLEKAKADYPCDVSLCEGSDGSYTASFPKKWIKIRPPRVLTDEQRAEIAQRFKK